MKERISQPTWEIPRHSRRLKFTFLGTLRDIVDQDYLAARTAWRAKLLPSYFWAASQAFEKYLKCIGALNGLSKSSGRGHSLLQLIAHLEHGLPYALELQRSTIEFLAQLEKIAYRYGQVSWDNVGMHLLNLDLAVWDVRRYVQSLAPAYDESEDNDLNHWVMCATKQSGERLLRIQQAAGQHASEFQLDGGWLEQVIAQKNHVARSHLIWNNPCYSAVRRKKVRVYTGLELRNSPLFIYPEVVDAYCLHVFLEKEIADGYRALAEQREKADGS